ncbi:General secretion pathway protein A [hydrothermal vent metagenome]|uniref:General secretion pathway protein A n=1 Tax=hydrothermal vent metagenome TaxID=652676 RepID=A0A3B0WJW9_9ZZZZ
MYNEYFGFKEAPFSIAPDPRYLYMTAQHREALAHLVYGLNSDGGCILLTGEVGTGKTTICRCLLEQIPDQANVALVLNPKVNEIELLETICDELKIEYPEASNSVKTYTDRIYKYLITRHEKGEKTVLIIDEAQNLDSKVLEQLRLLTNLETNQYKLLQIIILGQPELLDILAQSEMRQLAQRITARFHLQPLTKHELKSYLSHRLAVAGQNIQLFQENSIKLLYKYSNGVPRLINIICDRALLGAYVENQYAVTPATIKKASSEVFGELKNVENQQKNKQWLYPLAAMTGIGMIVVGLYYFLNTVDTPIENTPQTVQIENQKETITTENFTLKENAQENETPVQMITAVEPSLMEQQDKYDDDINNKQNNFDDINKLLSDENNDQVAAYQQLFVLWNQTYNAKTSVTACKQAQNLSLSCMHKQGNLNSLRIHNRPAVLTLINNKGEQRHATITSIDENSASLISNGTTYKVSLYELDRHWYGQFTLLWNKPDNYSSSITPGDSGEIINWLTVQLAKINNNSSDVIISTYDDYLIEKVIAFQARQGLTADGIVGPVTIIHLNTQSGMQVPSLTPLENQG